MQISDEAVEAAARAIWRLERENHAHDEPFNKNWYAGSARAALEAALPHLLASQGCGTGHSGERLEPAVGAAAALARPLRDGMDLIGRRASKDADAYAEALRNVNKMRDDGSLPDGGEAVHSPDEREALAAHPQKGGEG